MEVARLRRIARPEKGDRAPGAIAERAAAVKQLMDLIYPGRKIPLEAVRGLVLEAYRSADDNYGEREALEWAEGFQFSGDIGVRDAVGLASAGGRLEVYVREVHEQMSRGGKRLSRESILKWVPVRDADRDRLLGLVGGIAIVTPPAYGISTID